MSLRLFLLLLFVATSLPAQDNPILVRGARVFDGTNLLGERDVLLRGGRIAAIGPRLEAPGATVVEARGKTLLPGFIDAHTHTFSDVLSQALAFGVTTQLEQFTDVRSVRLWHDEQRTGKANNRADVFSAGVLVTAPGGHGTQFGITIPTIAKPESAQAFVDARIAEGSDWIKIVYDDGRAYALNRPTLDSATMHAVVTAAHKRGKLAIVHVHSLSFARSAIAAGADGLVHVFADTDSIAEFVALAKRRGAFVIPTLAVNKSVTGVAGGAPLIDDARVDSLLTATDLGQLRQAFPTRPNSPARYAHAQAAVRALNAAGVPILAGTDAPNPGTTHGASIHSELELLVEAGLTPTQALASATSVTARAFRLADRGRIATGLRADLVLVNGDPTTDIKAARSIHSIWKGGVQFDRAAYAVRARATRVAAAAASTRVEPGVVSTFDDGTPRSRFGMGWSVNTDELAGGKSKGEVTIVDGGAEGSAKALRVTGTVDGTLPYAWAGAVLMPASAPMQPADLSAAKEISFWARGDGKVYRVMLFAQSRGMTPLTRTFQSTPEWKEHTIPFTAFGIEGKDVIMLIIAAGPAPGAFELFLDGVKLR
jgi:imidazolonepropionase-like amidohydrolase